MKFRVLRGVHQEDSGTYTKNQVVDSNTNLVQRFNVRGFPKFEKVPDNTPVSKAGPAKVKKVKPKQVKESKEPDQPFHEEFLNGKNRKELEQIAQDEQVSIDPGMTKQEIVDAILGEE